MTTITPNQKSPEQQIRALAAQDPTIVAAFGGTQKFDAVLQKVAQLDAAFAHDGGTFFALGKTPQETAENFTRIHIRQYRDESRPSLPALVAHHLDDIGLSPDSPHYKAALLTAARAEVELSKTPQYHNKNHYADVTAQLANFVKRNNALADKGFPGAHKLTAEEMADSITAAVGHDIDHPGGKNTQPGEKLSAENRLRLEEQSFAAMLPLLKSAGLSPADIDGIHVMIQTTSPDGPHHILKACAAADQKGESLTWADLDPKGAMPELKELGEKLLASPKLTARAAMLEDADLGASAFEGLVSNVAMSEGFSRELMERGYGENLRGPSARQGFSDFVVGSGPASAAAQDAVGQNFRDLYAATVPLANQLKALSVAWQDGVMESGTPYSRAEATGLNDMQINSATKAMQAAGLKPAVEKEGDKTVFRIEGADVAALKNLRADVIARMDWQPAETAQGVTVTRVTAAPLGADEIKALNNALKGEGIAPRASSNDIEVAGDDRALVTRFTQEAQRKQAPVQPPAAMRPRTPGLG